MTGPACYIAQAQVLVAPGPTTSGGAMNAIDRERTLARFWAKVNKTETCWLWTGDQSGIGYGRIRIPGGHLLAHRVAYEAVVGPIPADLVIDHLCRVRHCVNPAHLEPVSVRENTLRGVGPTAVNATKTMCPRGHAFDRVRPAGWRACMTCEREASARYRARIAELRKAGAA